MNKVRTKRRLLATCLATCLFGASLIAQSDTVVRIIQTNSAGTNAHIIDPNTNEVVGIIEGVHTDVDSQPLRWCARPRRW